MRDNEEMKGEMPFLTARILTNLYVQDVDTDSMDSGDNKETQHKEDDITEENGELSEYEDGHVGNLVNKSYVENERLSAEDIKGNTETNDMVRLVAVEFEDNEVYNNENYSLDINERVEIAGENADLVHEEDYSSEYEAAIGKDDDNDFSNQDAIDGSSFHQSESESANVALKLGDRPRQQVEMSLYSSAAKKDLYLYLLLLPPIFVWRKISLA